jgi:formiminotetrahydrofolate cyclodeaminase
MGGKSDPPPPPNYGPLASASEKSAELSYRMAQEQLSWAKQTYAENKQTTDRVVDSFLNYQEENAVNARKDRARYEQIFQPLEEDLVEDAEGYTDARNRARGEQAAGKAAADVSQQFQLARSAAQDRLESFGIDPSQTRSGALDVQTRIAEAAARAGTANVAREGTIRAEEATGRALRSEALNVGKGYPGQIAGQYGVAMQAGQGATGQNLAQTASGASTMGTGTQWQGMGNQAIGQWGNILNQGYNNQMAGWKAQQEQSSGWGQALGMVAGMGSKAMFGFAEGGAVPVMDSDQAPAGVQLDPAMSPSQGVETDDIPAMLNADEFVIPADVLKWKGEEFFQKTIQKSREAKEEAPAKPTVMMQGVPVVPPGNPSRQALPLG